MSSEHTVPPATRAQAQSLPARGQRLLITSALPYANGSAHLGHLVEYILTDIYVRAQQALGQDAHFVWANDAHGTPIELNARKLGITPEELIARYHREQLQDFRRFGIEPAIFSSTHDETNRLLVEEIYRRLRQKDCIVEREVEGNYCPKDLRFLPDRFVRGRCPKCDAEDQYGDVCERCGATYQPTDLIAPSCALCGTPPERRLSRHAFYRLSRPSTVDFLRRWIDSGTLQLDVRNYVHSWLEQGLKDWCISRDGPYFGFAIPDMPGKFFYVWLDAPVGYIAASVDWGQKYGHTLDDLWGSPKTRVEHVIGKDIMYFHTLFWPAVLHDAGLTLPSKVHVHGMLTVDGEKMSKSRGTFINASTFADHIEPEALRFYNATKYSTESRDMDLSFPDFVARVNGELVNKHVNLFSRLARFVHARLDGVLPALPFSRADIPNLAGKPEGSEWLALASKTLGLGQRIEAAYAARDIALAMRLTAEIADLANEAMQEAAPWAVIEQQRARAADICAVVAAIADAVIMYLAPVVPKLIGKAAATFQFAPLPMSHERLFQGQARALQPFERLLDRVELSACERIVAASREQMPAPAKEPDRPTVAPQKSPAKHPPKQVTPAQGASETSPISMAQFAAIELRVGTVLSAEAVPKSKRLLQLSVELGEERPRQILAGLRPTYGPDELLGTQVVVVANLAPAKIMGLLSEGMVLAADGAEGQPCVLRPESGLPNGARIH